jgi:hypothetical protein
VQSCRPLVHLAYSLFPLIHEITITLKNLYFQCNLLKENYVDCPLDPSKPPKEPAGGNLAVLIYMTVGRQHNERPNTLTNLKRRTETSGTHADILSDLRVIQNPYPLIEASRIIPHVTSLDEWRRYARVQSFPNTISLLSQA